MRAAVVCALAGLVPAQAFMPGAVLPVRSAALASSHALASPLRSHAPSLALNKRRGSVPVMSANANAVPAAPAKSFLQKVSKVFLAMATIFCLLLGAPFDADAASRKSGGRSGGRMGGGFNKARPTTTQSKVLPASSTTPATTATAATAAPAAATAGATTVVHHHHHGGGGGLGGFGLGLGMGSMMSPWGWSPFGGMGMGMGYGMFGFRPIVPISTFLIFGAVAMAWFMIFSNRR